MTDSRKTAIVTGASQGIGAALVEEYLKRCYAVVANSRNIAKTNSLPSSARLALIDGDIGDPKTAEKVVGAALSRFGRIDVLINNAGILISKPFIEYTTEDLNAVNRIGTGKRVCCH
jgi:NAD(P)-dependent dehydrogenase (short-subunit alcohol dehydrogenase family)